MFFVSIKEINKLISKGMSNAYLKVTITQISLSFKTSCDLKIRGQWANTRVAFL